MTSKEIFDKGYAIPSFSMENDLVRWRYRDEEFVLPLLAVQTEQLGGVGFSVAKIEDVRAAHG